MNTDLIEDLRAIDPLPAHGAPPPVADMIEQLRIDEHVPRSTPPDRKPTGRRQIGRRVIVTGALAGACLAVVLALSDLGGARTDVAAAAYRATAPGTGVLQMKILTERTVGTATTTSQREIWTAQDPRRMRLILSGPEGTLESSLSTHPTHLLQWSSSRPNVIVQSAPTGIETTELSPVDLIHRLLGEGRASIAGKTTYEGREAWALQIHPDTPPVSLEGHQLPDPTLLVAAGSYAPLELTEHFLVNEGGGSQVAEQRERYLEYTQLPASAGSEALLSLAPHPGATVQSEH